MKKLLLLIHIVFLTINTQAQEISDTSFGKGLINFVEIGFLLRNLAKAFL